MGDALVIRVAKSIWTNFWCYSLLFSSVFVTLESRQMNNYVSVNYLADGEVETRIHYNGISAKETSVSNRNSSGLMIRELTDGRRFIQLVYKNGTLKDCNYGRRKEQIQTFLNVFNRDNKNLTVSTSNLVIEKLDSSRPLPKNVRMWFNYPKLRKLCRKKQRQAKRKLKKEEREFELNFDSRPKRDMDDLLRIPGTHWCGKGYSATKYTQLGFFSKTDKCCRTHDLACPFWIGGMETKYGLHNFRANTLMHCGCDERFRACLKMVGTTDADIVGKIFFNWVQTKCFIIKRKRICVEWEGKKCVKKKIVKRAILKQNLPY